MFLSRTAVTGWLHPAHSLHPAGRVSALLSNDKALQCHETRRDALENVAKEAAKGRVVDKPENKDITLQEEMQVEPKTVSVCRNRLSLIVPSGEGEFHIPLLLSDIVHAAVPAHNTNNDNLGVKGADFVIAIGPRTNSSKQFGQEEEVLLTAGLGEQLPCEVWLLCVGNCDSVGLQRILSDLSSFGALRWDLHQTYSMESCGLGSGGQGTVWLGQANNVANANHYVAMKMHNKSGTDAEAAIRNEVNYLAKGRSHPNINTLIGVFCQLQEEMEEEEHVDPLCSDSSESKPMPHLRWCIVLNLCTGGDLLDFLREHGAFSQTKAIEMITGVVSALSHLHGMQIVHRDVKSENVLVSQNQPILTDLGSAAHTSDSASMSQSVGSPGYAAPEVVDLREPYNEKVDIFSTGILLYFMLSLKLPFHDRDAGRVLLKTIKCKISFRNEAFQDLSGITLAWLKSLLDKDPNKRPSAACALKDLESTGGMRPQERAAQHQHARLRGASSPHGQVLPRSSTPMPAASNQEGQEGAQHQQPQSMHPVLNQAPRPQSSRQTGTSDRMDGAAAPPSVQPAKPGFVRWARNRLENAFTGWQVSGAASSSTTTRSNAGSSYMQTQVSTRPSPPSQSRPSYTRPRHGQAAKTRCRSE
eukprot:TRINITY_DN15077_c0_g1_i1.p1 TRINITY_DN15077_c0_g1~~TRINITY_DN15077_c0_g1_i1.p1  ORF type:complete len:642 (-),score=84.55 TRINITY_DN15077_c0_g1_i1:155-2080(-)